MTQEKDWPKWTPEKNNVLQLVEPEQSAPSSAAQSLKKSCKSERDKERYLAAKEAKAESARQEAARLPACAKFRTNAGGFFGNYYVPVSFVAKDWKVTPRRIRALLVAGRLSGRVQENGYWEVIYPYNVTLRRCGPPPKREQKAERRAE